MKQRASSFSKIKDSIISILDEYLDNNYLLFIFGSFAKGKIDRSSDIDLAIYSNRTLSSLISQIKEDLERKVPTLRNIDLVDLTDPMVNKELLGRILKEGRLWRRPRNLKGLLRNLKEYLKNLKR